MPPKILRPPIMTGPLLAHKQNSVLSVINVKTILRVDVVPLRSFIEIVNLTKLIDYNMKNITKTLTVDIMIFFLVDGGGRGEESYHTDLIISPLCISDT